MCKQEIKPLISVIVPIYNVEDYLTKCLDSIVSQTYDNFEVILVDDGSTDQCPRMCDEYKERNSRFKVIHKSNGGVSSARNKGLDIAEGEYVLFVDSDDWLEPNMLEVLASTATETDADIVVCEHYNNTYNTETRSTISRNTYEKKVLVDNDDIFMHILAPSPRIRFEVWNKLYKREIIGKTRFKEGQIYEDVSFQKEIFERVKKLVHIDCALYNYRTVRPGNTVSSFDKKRLCKLNDLDEYIKTFKQKGRTDIARIYQEYAAESVIDLYRTAVKKKKLDKDTRTILKRKFNEYFREDGCRSIRHVVFRISPSMYDFCAAVLK